MQSAPAGLWDPHGPQSKDVSSLPVHTPSASRLSHVIAALPTKRITFYKSGDAKFAGVRMAVHKRSFKCFDALLDDLSQKVPLPFGVRTVTTPRGIHSIKHLEQLEDGGCYLCSDRRQAKPINMELAGKRPALWHHNSRRVPQRPAEDPPPPSAPSHTPTRQRRILLVRNSDPAVRRSVILSRRSARSLRVFLEGISEIMQCHVRKLYTLEGRKIDSAQSLMTCPGVLVCVGREPFRPLLLNYVAKHSEEKLPGLGTRSPVSGARSPGTGARSPRNGQGARSRSSVCSEGHGSKKNVNFGLETKKTIIHPLSDSSNRSTRFSLSSDKSYPNGLSSQGGKEAVLNDDIEKRVLVNKDGSLSVEMRVRFRLHNDERLQWSTEIKKSPSDSLTNDCCPLREAPPCFLQQGQSESCSDPDSASCVVEAADYTPKPPQRSLEEPQSHYACCFQRQEYDLWENPAHIQTSKHSHSRVRHTHSSSSSSSCRSSKLVRRRATHRECSELGRVVHGMVEVCTVSSSCSHSELNLGATDNQGEERPLSSSSHVLQALQDDVDDLPPSVSRCCHSNEPPQALPLTPQPPNPMSTSPRSRKHTPALQGEERGSKTSSRRSSNSCSCCRGEVTPKADEERVDSSLSKASHASHRSRSPSNRISIPVAPEEGDDEAEQGGKRAVSISGGSGESIGSHIGQSDLKKKRRRRGQGEDSQVAQMTKQMGPPKLQRGRLPDQNQTSLRIQEQQRQRTEEPVSCEGEEEEVGEKTEERLESSMSVRSNLSAKSRRSCKSTCSKAEQVLSANSPEVPATEPEPTGEDEGEERATISTSVKSNLSAKSSRSHSPKPAASETLVNDPADADAAGALSAKTNASAKSRRSCKSTGDDEREEREARATSAKTRASIKFSRTHKSACKAASTKPAACETPVNDPEEKTEEEKTASALSAKTSASVRSSRSHKSTCSRSVRAETPVAKDIPAIETTEGDENGSAAAGETEERPASAILDNNNASVKSSISHKSTCSKAERAPSSNSPEVPATEPEPTGDDEGEKRAASATSKSSRSLQSTCSRNVWAETPGTKDIPVITTTGGEEMVDDTTAAGDTEERPPSAISAKTSASVKSSRSHKSTCSRRAESRRSQPADLPVIETTGREEVGEEKERADSVMSAKSNASAMSRKSNRPTCNGSSRAVSPVAQDVPAIETTGGKEQRDKSTASVKTNRSHKSSSASQANAKSTNHTPPTTTETKEESQSHATSRPASTAAHRDDDVRDHVTEKKAPSVHSKSPAKAEGDSRAASFARSTRSKVKVQKASEAQDDEMPETRASFLQVKGHRVKAQSDTGSVHSVKTSKTDKIVIKGNSKPKSAQAGNPTSQSFNPPEGSRPAIQLGTASVSDSLLSQSLSAADLLRGNMATSRLSSPAGSKVSIPDSGKSGKSGSSQRRRKLKQEEAELEELGPLCLPKTSPNDIVSDWLRGIPADSGMDNPEDEMNEGIEETEEEEEEEEQENTAETGQREEEEEQENTAETGQEEEEEEQENTAETGQQEEEEEQENTAETGQQEEEEEQENMAKTGQREEEEEQENTAETGQQEEEEEQENTAETGQQEEEEEQENMAKTGQREEEEEQENTAETGQEEEEEEEEEEQENTAETGQQEEEEEQENMAKTGQREEEEEQENTAETGQEEEEEEEEEEQENTAETGQQEEEEEQENTAETGQQEEEQENTAETGQQEEEEEQENMAETGQEEEEQENTAETGQQDEEVKKAARQPEEEGEISPVYGRRLSSSAKGLLDCLAQLQLIDPPPSPAAAPGPDRDQRYQEVMDILESLWLSKPDLEKRKEGETEEKERLKDSGVDLSSGSAGSGGSGKTRPDETGGEGETDGGGEGETYGRGEEATSAELLSDAATPDIASQVRSSPGEDESPPESPPRTGEMLQTLERLKTPGSPSSSDSTAYKSPTDTETDTPEDTPSSGTPPSVQRPLLTKRISQDPDPVWVLNLLKKLEKQFMTHYVDAMAELKVRWDLDNNVMLDTMITELRDEVKKRIQMSIDRELRKIRGRAGRGPRPPNMSRESTITDQRRRRLKVMKVQSVNESDGEQGSGDVSDQRSEDEYCPCDACIRKKAEDKAIKMEAVVAKAPVMMAFDLRKILQMKKDPESPVPPRPTQGKNNDKLEEEEEEQVGNLEVVHEDEEEEETKEDIIPTVIEEDISEKEEEGVTGGEEEGQESHRAESLMGEVGEEIAEEIGAEEQEEDGVVEGTEDEEEEAGEGETGCESAGEDGVEGAETGEGEELVEGEEEEAGEAEAGDQEKDGGDEAGDQEEAAGDEETGVAGETGGEGGTGGEEETPEEETEGNVGVSAEDEEEGGEEEVQLNAVVEFNPEDEEGEEMEGNREIPLIHQMTRTSVESQPGSMENTNPEPRASDPVSQMCSLTLIEPNETVSDGHQMASAGEGSGGKGQRRSRSPARIKRRKPKESGIELDVLDL
ncbi:retinitis pigmentosa 1-like 1 protein [Oncorhynchus tshawytscha]|uniref:retinitis pigmentosa 1-like 1 protein n=1 Tax=Oncorhynchus tshawytscha TaxID=74940 RepID=UPI001C3CC95C|nr:retinitis pigmentosa 1-like 1 protein [Oncorhynchus tshawytscha]